MDAIAIFDIRAVEAPDEKSQICEAVLRSLPNWFGIEAAIVDYTNGARAMPFFAVYDDGQVPVGFVCIKEHNTHTAEVCVMGVLQPYHRLGIGKRLIERCEDYCRERGKTFLTVKTLAESHPDEGYAKTRLFYQAMGFVPLEVFPLHWDESNPCLFMAKRL